MGGLSLWHWLVVLLIIITIFGTSKFKKAGKDLGEAVKGFKDALKETDKCDKQ